MLRKGKILLSLLMLSSAIMVKISICTPQEPSNTFGNTELPEGHINWDEFWALLNSVSAWDLEYNQGPGWNSVKEDLTILRNYPEPWLCKISLIFNASYHADYRLTFLIDRRVKNYTHVEDRTRYLLSYQNYTLFFSWEDLLGIPGLQFSHGVKEISGKPCFWFRLRRNDVPKGTYLELDPTFGCDTSYYGVTASRLKNHIKGGEYTCPEDGLAQNITLFLENFIAGAKLEGALYDSDRDFIASTDEWTMSGSEEAGWYSLTFSEPKPPIFGGSSYIICVWAGNMGPSDEVWVASNDTGSSDFWWEEHTYDGWPQNLSDPGSNYEASIYCGYTCAAAPTIGAFKSSEDPVYANSWFSLNCTINDGDGISELKNCTLELSGDIILAWDNSSSSFSVEYDPNGYCALNSSECVEAQIDNATFELSWRIQLSQSYPHGEKPDVVAANTKVYDTHGFSGSGCHSDLFLFEPEQKYEPRGLTGGPVRRTPLEKIGVPTPLPYEVAPPEAQYGTMGLVVIMVGAVIYYIRKPKTTLELWKATTKPSVKYGPRKGSKRKIKQKKQPKRRIHSKRGKRG